MSTAMPFSSTPIIKAPPPPPPTPLKSSTSQQQQQLQLQQSNTSVLHSADSTNLKAIYPLGSTLDAFVTNVHNVPQLRFFMFVRNMTNAHHFASVRNTTTPPAAYNCLRMPREGVVFGLRLGDAAVLRAIRLRTMCITTTHEVFLPDVGRYQVLDTSNMDMFHLPLKLRKTPGVAVCCQLRGINDDVTIVPDNMRANLKGLLFRSVKLRVDGYVGAILKVQLLGITLEQLKDWNKQLNKKQNDLVFALRHLTLYKPNPEDVTKRLEKELTAGDISDVSVTPNSLAPPSEISAEQQQQDSSFNDDDSNDNNNSMDADKTENSKQRLPTIPESPLSDIDDNDNDDNDDGDDINSDHVDGKGKLDDDTDVEDDKVSDDGSTKCIDVAELFEYAKSPKDVIMPTSPAPSPASSVYSDTTYSPRSSKASEEDSLNSSSSHSWLSKLDTILISSKKLEEIAGGPTSTTYLDSVDSGNIIDSDRRDGSGNGNETVDSGVCGGGGDGDNSDLNKSFSSNVTPTTNKSQFNMALYINGTLPNWLNRYSPRGDSYNHCVEGRAIRGGNSAANLSSNTYNNRSITPRHPGSKYAMRPLLGYSPVQQQQRPILGSGGFTIGVGCVNNYASGTSGLKQSPDRAWRRDFLPALAIIDKRNLIFNSSRVGNMLTITMTFISQLERFFGVVHHRGECYLQHMWTEDEIPWTSRFSDTRTPYIFDIVLAKHSGDFKWYRAKVIEIIKKKHTVRVFFVDYGGEEYIQLKNLAQLDPSIAKLPFQATLFRLDDLIDATTTRNEHALGVDIMRRTLLKETMSVRVISYEHDEITIRIEDTRFLHLPETMIRKGLMKRLSTIDW